jgi:histone demethylase JARID1
MTQIRVFKVYQEEGDMVLTFPGAYHGGFSPTFNVCEAVNMACLDWVPAARKHLEMNAREGHPRKSCFSLEWLIYECWRHVEKLHFSQECRSQLRAEYERMAEKEVSLRKAAREKGVVEEELFNEKKFKFFDVQCSVCRSYTYLSVVGCRKCQSVRCLECRRGCECTPTREVLFVRTTDKELVNC